MPFLLLLVLIGASGLFLIVRDLSSRAQTMLDQDLSALSLDARSFLRDRELYLVEAGNFATNLHGIADAVRRKDRAGVARLALSVLALKQDLGLLVVTDAAGAGIAAFDDGKQRDDPGTWADRPFVSEVLADRSGRKASGFLVQEDRTLLVIAAPICAVADSCTPVGAAVTGLDVTDLVTGAFKISPSAGVNRRMGLAIFDGSGRRLAAAGPLPSGSVPPLAESRLVRRTERAGAEELATAFVAFAVQGRRVGTIAVSLPTAPAFAAVRGAAVRLAAVALAAMVGVVTIGALLSRFILAQVRRLLAANRALGAGDLGARVPVIGRDELGELAAGVNQMAEQLQASYETLELRVAARTEEVQRLLTERTEFFAAISHELRTPLAVLLTQAKLILDPTYRMLGKSRTVIGDTVQTSAEQLLKVVNDILDVAQAETGRVELSIEPVKLPDFLKEMRGTIKGLARTGRLGVSIDVPKDLPAILADRSRLRQILLNLLENAVKYTPSGGSVSLSAAANNGSVEISVSDTGIGIPPEAGARIFEPFFRVEGAKTQGGQPSSGLGLAVTKRLVEAHGGAIAFESRQGRGTRFHFKLPATDTNGTRRGGR